MSCANPLSLIYSQIVNLWHNNQMAYSHELREHLFKVKDDEGLTFEETSSRFHRSIRSLFRWQQRIEPQTHHKKKSSKIDLEKLAENVEQYPDWYQKERANHFGVSQSSICAALKAIHISNTKNAQTSQSGRSAKS